MDYKYKTPEEAIISLEKAYSNEDLQKIIDSKDFKTEARLLLEQTSIEITDDIIEEVSKLLELKLVENLQENGFPNFEEARREFSELNHLKDNIFFIEERIFYPDNTSFVSKLFLSNNNDLWKVAMVEE